MRLSAAVVLPLPFKLGFIPQASLLQGVQACLSKLFKL